ncbi:MAG: DNA polymerase III subunit delta [Treponema sp.]|jgi:DNA polymerase-3 subunit delta|nr:DNA polymerase III subunit delta [Treponema sp.]
MIEKQSCWIFLGPELGKKNEALKDLKKRLSASGSEPELTSYYAGETSVGEMVSALQNGSLFADLRLFIIKNAENIKKKEDIDLIASYMAKPDANTTLVLISEENSIAKGLEKAALGNVRKFYELLEQEKTDWVKNFFRNAGFRLNNDAIETLLELVENNTLALHRECSRLLPFLSKDEEIGPEEIEKYLSHTRAESAFTLFSRIAAGDFQRSLESLRTLLQAKEAPISILAGLLWSFKKLRDYLFLEEARIRDDAEYRKIGVIAPQAKRDYANAAQRYNSETAESCIKITAEYDLRIRQAYSFPDHILMDEYLYKICSLALNRA